MLLLIVLAINGADFIVGSVHAPIDKDDESETFFQELIAKVQGMEDKRPHDTVFLLSDLNARVGECASAVIGGVGA